ncbi:MAG TPA: class F sortase [Actinomycetota bacterium]|nr:class F sortase [Actinomycetota bacterium]
MPAGARFTSRVLALCCALTVAAGCAGVDGDVAPALRVVSTPFPTPSPTAAPTPAGVRAAADDGSLTNSGGRIRWVPTARPGPFPEPASVSLPTLGEQAPIVRVGVNLKGEMAVPTNARQVAWLDQGPFPGATQNAVLAGHKNYAGRVGTFNNLSRLGPGDPIVVEYAGRRWEYRTIWVRQYDPDTAPVQKLMGFTETHSVTLITCGGVFNRRTRHYEDRMIARGELVSGPPLEEVPEVRGRLGAVLG